MKAAQFSEYGKVSVITINEVDKPALQPGQVLVEVHAASLNPWDSMVREGFAKEFLPLELPVTTGGDLAGIVVEVGEGVSGVSVGDKVFGGAGVPAGSGSLAEFAAAMAERLAKMPSNLDFQQAASLPLVGTSALQALTQHIDLKEGQKIFIHGGGGGIGAVAIQVAKYLGAHVATTATGKDDLEYVKTLGADEVIDYKTEDFATKLQDYDAVYDTVGHGEFVKALPVLKKGGIGVSMLEQIEDSVARGFEVTAITQQTNTTTEVLNQLRDLVENGVVKPRVGQTFPLDQVREAFEARESGIKGKVVVSIK